MVGSAVGTRPRAVPPRGPPPGSPAAADLQATHLPGLATELCITVAVDLAGLLTQYACVLPIAGILSDLAVSIVAAIEAYIMLPAGKVERVCTAVGINKIGAILGYATASTILAIHACRQGQRTAHSAGRSKHTAPVTANDHCGRT